MIDKDVFAQGMGQLGGAFGREIDGPVSKMYYATLSPHLTNEEWIEAVTRTVTEETFWPSPAVVLSKIKETEQESAVRAFAHVKRTLALYGGFRFIPVDVAKSFDSATWAAIKELGGLSQVMEENEKKFTRAYLNFLKPRAPRIKPSEDSRVKQLTSGIGSGGRDKALPSGDR